MTKGIRLPLIDGLKYCQRCERHLPLSEFYRDPKNTMYGVRSPCKSCLKKDTKTRYHTDGSAGKLRNAKTLEARKRLKQQLVKAAGGCCSRCGYNRSVAALDFHHTQNDKESCVTDLITKAVAGKGKHLQTAFNEATKCILLCANCHRELHAHE